MPNKTAVEKEIRTAEKALKHLAKVDKKLANLIETVGPFRLEISHVQSTYEALAEAIVYQQLTGKAAASIFKRLQVLTNEDQFPTPEEILALPESAIRAVGLSQAKTNAIIDLAQKTKDGLIPSAQEMESMTDADILKALTAVRGIGPWSVEMLLMFRLGRLDVMPSTDYGVRKGFAITYGVKKKPSTKQIDKANKIIDLLPTPKELLEYAECWRPFRSVASWYMWRAIELHQQQNKLENQKAVKTSKKTPTTKTAATKTKATKSNKTSATTKKPVSKAKVETKKTTKTIQK